MFRNATIKTRLIFVLLLLAVELVAGAAIGLLSLSRANDDMTSMYEDSVVCLGQLDRIIRALNRDQTAMARAATAEAGALPAFAAEIEANGRVADADWKAYMATHQSPEESALAQKVAQAERAFNDGALQPALAALRAGDQTALAPLVHGPMVKLYEPLRGAMDALIKLQLAEANKLATHSREAYSLVRVLCLSGMSAGLLLAAVIGTLLVRGIVQPLGEAVRIAHGVAAGDLTQRIDVRSGDETGRMMAALRDMNAGLVRIVGQVRGGTDTIAATAGQLAAGNQDLSARTEQQAAAIEETASSLEQLTETVRQNADHAHQAKELALSASNVATKGGAVVSEVVQTMGAINASARKIVDIIGVIDGIAFQTNILALNAAVEAARAGEQGRGFAVVASEVRNLAQRSATAAKEIKDLILASVDQVDAGSRLADGAGQAMGEIVQSVQRVAGLVAQIATASDEQSKGIGQVNGAIGEMDSVTQQNAALVEEAAAAAESLRLQAAALEQVVGTFKLEAAAPGAVSVPRKMLTA
jgi:methyl-accepting chemotaxis protein-1 (serine sensor receptor)